MKEILGKYWWVFLILVIIAYFIIVQRRKNAPSGLAQCIARSGAKFYGAYYCHYCESEKRRFGKDAKYLPYVECTERGTPEEQNECKSKGVSGYPTWIFADGSRLSGDLPIETLSQKTNCKIS